ncbi:MAG TPA: amidohydrolase family protein [Turneriella sp.]|nr:amidohydrolase family protein [Turneriella sp.]
MAIIIDSHAHFEPRMLGEDDWLRKLDVAGVDKVALIPSMNDPLPPVPELLLGGVRLLMQSGFTRPIAELLHRATLTDAGNLRLLTGEYKIYAQPDNESAFALVRRHPDRFMSWAFLNPRADTKVLETLERWRHEKGMIGVKLHPHWHDYTTDLLFPLFARLEELGLPALIHLGFGRRGDYRAIAEKFPRLKIIAAHAGFPFYQDMWNFARQHNIYVDLSSPYIDESLARAAVKTMGAERCLYGTDAPYGFSDEGHSYDYTAIRGWVERMPVSAREKEQIFGGNFMELICKAGVSAH